MQFAHVCFSSNDPLNEDVACNVLLWFLLFQDCVNADGCQKSGDQVFLVLQKLHAVPAMLKPKCCDVLFSTSCSNSSKTNKKSSHAKAGVIETANFPTIDFLVSIFSKELFY